MLMPRGNLKEKLLLEDTKDQETSIFTEKRTIYNREIGENFLFFADGKRRKSDSESHLRCILENKSEKSFNSFVNSPSLSKTNSSKIFSHEIENIIEIKVSNYSLKTNRRNKEKIVNFSAFSMIFSISSGLSNRF